MIYLAVLSHLAYDWSAGLPWLGGRDWWDVSLKEIGEGKE